MKVSQLMSSYQPDSSFTGFALCDDWVLAIDTSGGDGAVGDYETAQAGITGVEAVLTPITVEKQYIRSGLSTLKTGTRRSFLVTGDRCIGDAFQDFALSHAVKYGEGQQAIVRYVYFCLLDGKGERGQVSILTENDGSGNAGDSAAIRLRLMQVGEMPQEFTFSGAVA